MRKHSCTQSHEETIAPLPCPLYMYQPPRMGTRKRVRFLAPFINKWTEHGRVHKWLPQITRTLFVDEPLEILPGLKYVFDERMRVAHFVVVPRENFDEVAVYDAGHSQVRNRTVGRADDVV